jgi:hypothetical protein
VNAEHTTPRNADQPPAPDPTETTRRLVNLHASLAELVEQADLVRRTTSEDHQGATSRQVNLADKEASYRAYAHALVTVEIYTAELVADPRERDRQAEQRHALGRRVELALTGENRDSGRRALDPVDRLHREAVIRHRATEATLRARDQQHRGARQRQHTTRLGSARLPNLQRQEADRER